MSISDITDSEAALKAKRNIPRVKIIYISSVEIYSSFGKKNNSFVKSVLIEIHLLGGNPSIYKRTPTNVV